MRGPALGRKVITLSILAAGMQAGPAALAQDEEADLEEITVTGTRIRATNGMSTPTPVTSLSTEELLNFEPGGTVAEQLDALPQFFSTTTAQRGDDCLCQHGGGSYLNMRGLGLNRTLVLLDGARLPPSDKRGSVNVDNIPTPLMRSVDVVTGGASAAYGADAVGGVVNFILDREYEGMEASVSVGMNEFNQDGRNWNLSFAGGRQIGDRLNVIGSLQAREIDEIYRPASELDPDWFQNWGLMTNPDPNGPARITVPWITRTDRSPSGVISGTRTSLDGMQFTDDGKAIRPFILGDITAGGRTSGGPEAINDANSTTSPILGSGVVNRTGFLGLQYALTDSLNFFGQVAVGRTESDVVYKHSPFNRAFPWFMTIYRENPFIPEEVARIMDENGLSSFRLSKNGAYPGDLEPGVGERARTVFTTESWSAGFDYVLPNGWDLRASWQSGESRKVQGEYPSTRVDREGLSRDAVRDPATGAIVCNVQLYNPTEAELAASPAIQGLLSSRSGTPLASPIGLDNSIRDCVPYNAMGAGNMTQAAWEYVHTPKIGHSVVDQDFAELLLRGEAHEGWGYGPIAFATGLTWREQGFSDEARPAGVDELGPPFNDPALGIRGIATAYSGGSPNLHHFSTISFISGQYDVWEWFGELQFPFWESASGEQNLGGNMAFRTSDYSSSGRVDSWKIGLDFQIYSDLRLRATKSRDVREATFSERFDTQTGGAGVDDPFTGDLNVIVTALQGGNPELRPEFANTNVFGFVFQPSWVEGLQLSMDWYEVDLIDAVESISPQQIVDQCFATGAFCQNLSRDRFGTLVAVHAPYMNLAESRAEGIDYELTYRIEPDFFDGEFESLSLRALFGRLLERTDTPPDGAPINRIGSTSMPETTGQVTANYTLGPWSLLWQQRYISDAMLDVDWVEGVDVDDNSVPTYSFTNLRFGYQGETNAGGTWSLSLNVTNAFDKNPPIIPGGGGQNVPANYDEWGRRYQLSMSMNF